MAFLQSLLAGYSLWVLLPMQLTGFAAAVSLRTRGGRSIAQNVQIPAGVGIDDVRSNDDAISSYMHNLQASGVSVQDVIMYEHVLGLPPRNTTAEALAPRRTVVVARYDEDISWLRELPTNFDLVVYQSKNSSGPHFVENVGNEASKYLSYIVDNYNRLPDSVAFVQAGRQDWHDPIPKDLSLRAWDWKRARQQGGFSFLPTNAPCLIEDSVKLGPHAEPSVLPGQQCVALTEHRPKQMSTIRSIWPEVFASELGALPQRWLTHCCAQFEVTREAIQRHSRSFYQGLLSWVQQHDRDLQASNYGADMRRNHDVDRRDAGHVLEPIWVLLFSDTSEQVVRLPRLQVDTGDAN